MRCLTVKQPYAWAIMLGEKAIENRSQAWKYRGPVAVHAGAVYSDQGRAEVQSILGFCPTVLGSVTGAILGVVDLVDIHEGWDGCCAPWGRRGSRAHLELANPRLLPEPIPCRGQLGLWTPPEPVLAVLLANEPTPCVGCGKPVPRHSVVHRPLGSGHEPCLERLAAEVRS